MYSFETLNRKGTLSAKWDRALNKSDHPEDVLVFSVADSDYETAPEIQAALAERVKHGAFGYTHLGADYTTIIRDWFARHYQVQVRKHWVLSGSKVLNAISSLIRVFTDEGDSVLIQPPVYHVFKPLIEKSHRKVVDNTLIQVDGTYRIDFEGLESAFKDGVKVMVFCNPHNPVGRVWTPEEIKRLVALTDRYGVLLISDEIHADVIDAKHRFHSLGHYLEGYDHIIIVSAPSKTFNVAGLKSAHIIIANNTLRQTFKAFHEGSFQSGLNVMALTALKTAYTVCDDWVAAQNKHIETQHELAINALKEVEGITVYKPEGTYLLWVDVSKLMASGEAFAEALFTQAHMQVAPGEQFGPGGEGFIRMNLACSTAQAKAGLNRLIKVAQTLKGGS